MDGIIDFFKELVNPESIIRYGGIYLLLLVVFAETGLFVGFFLPGDSLLFTAGLFCYIGVLQMHPALLISLIIIAAVTGNLTGYVFGKKIGILLFKRKSGFLFRQEHLVAANEFYKKHGQKTIILSRFLPIVRTFAPIIAGIVKLEYYKFLLYSIIGAFFWVTSFILGGYYMGKYIPQTIEYLEYIVIFLIVVTSIPFIYNWMKKKFAKRKLMIESKNTH